MRKEIRNSVSHATRSLASVAGLHNDCAHVSGGLLVPLPANVGFLLQALSTFRLLPCIRHVILVE